MARQKKSCFVSSVGMAFEIQKRISETVADLGGCDDDLRRILSDKDLPRRIAEMIVASKFAPGNMKVSSFFPVVVDYGRSVTDMIRALKVHDRLMERLDCLPSNLPITPEMFNVEGTGRIEIEVAIVEFNDPAAYEEDKILDSLGRSGLQHAKIEHLLAFAERYPELTFNTNMIAPGCYDSERDLAKLTAMGSSVSSDKGVLGYPYLDKDIIYCQRFLSVMWNPQVGQLPRLLVTRKTKKDE